MDAPPRSQRDAAIGTLSEALADALAAHSPIHATLAGVPGHDSEWDDLGPSGIEAAAGLFADFDSRLRALEPSESAWGRRAARVMRDLIDERRAAIDQQDLFVDLNSIDSAFQSVCLVFDLMDPSTEEGLAAIDARLQTIDRPLRQYRERLEEGRRRGLVVARRQVAAVVGQARGLASPETALLRVHAAAATSPAAAGALTASVAQGVERARRAYGELADYLETSYGPHAVERDAVGRERYVRAARTFLGTSIDPDEAYAWGWEEVFSIRKRMDVLARQIRPGVAVPELIAELERDPRLVVDDEERFLDVMRARQHQAIDDLAGVHFDIPEPVRRIDVKKAPPGGAIGAYYTPPSDDFSRPGTIWYARAPRSTFPLYDEISTAYHEGFPGHHLQCSLAVFQREDLTRLHRLFVSYGGYAEGWALYAEALMHELGYLERPEFVLGMYKQKLVRALRVAADIGLHLELPIDERVPGHGGAPWSHDRCATLLSEVAFMARGHATSDATRYCGWPGQAVTYKLGERVVLELRARLAGQMGAAFALREFHRRVLGAGSVGLDHLRDVVLAEPDRESAD